MRTHTIMSCPKCRCLDMRDKGWYWECFKCGYTVEVTRTLSIKYEAKEADHEKPL